MKNYRLEQERKPKRRVHRLWQQRQPPEQPSRRRLAKLSEQSLKLFNQRSVRVAVFTIHLRLQWQRAPCAPRAARLAGNSFAEFLEEFSAAPAGEGNVAAFAPNAEDHPLLCRGGHCHAPDTSASTIKRNRRIRLGIRRFESFVAYFFGEGAGLAPSFFAPLPAFTSTSVADIV